jgi:hypothetical protein
MPEILKPGSMTQAALIGKLALPVMCVCVLWCGGCFTHKPAANRHVPIAFAHPVIPAAMVAVPLESAPELTVEIAPAPRLATPRSSPPKPRVAQVAPVGPAVAEKPAGPIIVPEMSSTQLNAAKAETQHSLEIAEWNLAQTKGKQLNSAQEDVVSKIRGFMEASKDAMNDSDWERAKNLAKKAEVLSHELVTNL